MKLSFLLVTVLALIVFTASSQVFKRHKIGETAEQFFSIAMMAEKGTLTTKYCKDYLSDPRVLKAHDKAKTNIFDTKALVQSADVDGCRTVQDALEGKEVEVGAHYASEFNRGGSATFHDSRLAILVFSLKEGTPFEDVVTDLKQELGGTEPTRSVDTQQNGFGATLQSRKAIWNVNNLNVQVSEARSFEYPDMGILVIVADSEYLKKKEAERQAKRPSTIR